MSRRSCRNFSVSQDALSRPALVATSARRRCSVGRGSADTFGPARIPAVAKHFPIVNDVARIARDVSLGARTSLLGPVTAEPEFARSSERPCLVGDSRQPKEPLDHERLPSARSPLIRPGRLRTAFNPMGKPRSPLGLVVPRG